MNAHSNPIGRRLLALFLVGALTPAIRASAFDGPATTPGPPPTDSTQSSPAAPGSNVVRVKVVDHATEDLRADSLQRVTKPRLYLSWGAPWGRPGATDRLRSACDDTLRVDTLWLCFDPGRNNPTYLGFIATLYVRPVEGDTLGSFWHLERGGENHRGMLAQYGPDSSFVLPQPWTTETTGTIFYDHTPSSGRIRLVCAIPRHMAGPVDSGRVYCLGRLLFRARRPDLAGCDRPACIEWGNAQLSYGRADTFTATLGERFVSWNAGAKDVCAPYRRKPAIAVETKRKGEKPLEDP